MKACAKRVRRWCQGCRCLFGLRTQQVASGEHRLPVGHGGAGTLSDFCWGGNLGKRRNHVKQGCENDMKDSRKSFKNIQEASFALVEKTFHFFIFSFFRFLKVCFFSRSEVGKHMGLSEHEVAAVMGWTTGEPWTELKKRGVLKRPGVWEKEGLIEGLNWLF